MRELIYLGSSFDDLMDVPPDVREEVLFALEIALDGGKAPSAKPLTGFRGSSVLEVVEAYDGDAYRAVIHREISACRLRAACIQKEVKIGESDTSQ